MTTLAGRLETYLGGGLTPDCAPRRSDLAPPATLLPAPVAYGLDRSTPNPVRLQADITYRLPESMRARLTIYDIEGREVKVLIDERQPAGAYRAIWDGTNRNGQRVEPGVYFYRLSAGEFSGTKKLIFIR